MSPEDQEQFELIIADRCPDAKSFLDIDAEGLDILCARLLRDFDVILCIGPAFTSLTEDNDLRKAFETFTAHAHLGTQLIVKKPAAVHQAHLETRAKTSRFMYYAPFGALQVFTFGSQCVDIIEDDGF